MSQAIRENRNQDGQYSCDFLAIEPYPPEYLKTWPVEVSRVLTSEIQTIPLEEFTSLQSGDILFIDSTHVAAIGSDVVFEYLEILPRLAAGVIVHIDDIFLPLNYPRNWIEDSRFFWNEQYLLQAFLAFNSEFNVLLPTHYLDEKYPEAISTNIKSCSNHQYSSTSFWLKKVLS